MQKAAPPDARRPLAPLLRDRLAAERETRAIADAEEQERQATAAALVLAAEARLRARLAALAPGAAPTIRRTLADICISEVDDQ